MSNQIVRIRCHHSSGRPTSFREAVEAVFAGRADPQEFSTALDRVAPDADAVIADPNN